MSVGGKAVSGKEAAALALHRFGFGPVGDQINAIAADPRGALQADLDRPAAGELKVDLPSSAEAARVVFDFQAKRRAQQILAQRAQKEADANDSRPDMADAGNAVAPPQPPNQPPLPQQLILNEAKARFDAAAGAEIGFVERLVWFWSNHFCISADKIVGMAAPYEREAIRPHVLGRFADLLLAVEGHPAMLFYLDNVESMGPNSIAGINRDKGLNENLARETLELHTLGVRSGYTQTDVTSFAKVLTGWTWIPPSEPEPWRRVHLQRAPARAGRADRARQDLSATPASIKAARCSPISRGIRPPRNTSRNKLARAFCRRRSAAYAGRQAGEDASATTTAISKKSRRRLSLRRRILDAAAATS